MINFIKNKKVIIIILAIITLIIPIFIFIFKNSNKKIEILIAPASAEIIIDGKTYQNGTYIFKPKEVSVEIKKDGFNTKSFTVDLTKTDKIYSYLTQTDGSFTWYENHQDDALILNSIGGYESIKLSDEYFAKYPIMEILPIIVANYDSKYNYTEYRIDGGHFDECPEEFCIKITDVTGDNKNPAIEKIRQAGFDPSKYPILYQHTPIEPLN